MTDTPTLPEGFIAWAGGKCPVPLDSKPGVILKGEGSATECGQLYYAGQWDWQHSPLKPGLRNIIAYRPDPNYGPPIDWQARAEKAETELSAASKTVKVNEARRIAANNQWRLDYNNYAVKAEAELATLRTKAEKMAAALALGLEYWAHRQQRYKNRSPEWVKDARTALAEWENSNG